MADDSRKLSITYSSGLVPPPELTSTLAVFYDEIWLPHPYDLDPDGVRLIGLSSIRDDHTGLGCVDRREVFVRMRCQWKLLYEHDILRTVPPVYGVDLSPVYREGSINLGRGVVSGWSSVYYPEKDVEILVPERAILAMHAIYGHKPSPEIFISDPLDTRTPRLTGFLVRSLFDHKVPQLQALNAEQILEVRDYLKDTKDGFRYYINEMTDDVEKRIQEHNLSEIIRRYLRITHLLSTCCRISVPGHRTRKACTSEELLASIRQAFSTSGVIPGLGAPTRGNLGDPAAL